MVSNIRRIKSPTEVDHYQLRRVIDIYVQPVGEDLGRIASSHRRAHRADHTFPTESPSRCAGWCRACGRAFSSFGVGLMLSVVLLYLILVAQFRSFLDPLLILTAVPPGLTGALLILYLTGTSMNVMSLMGLMILIGMTVSDSILIVEFTRHLREDGMTRAAGGGHGGARAPASRADDVARHHHRAAADGAEAGRRQRILRAAGPRRAGRHERVADDDRHHGAGGLLRGLPQR